MRDTAKKQTEDAKRQTEADTDQSFTPDTQNSPIDQNDTDVKLNIQTPETMVTDKLLQTNIDDEIVEFDDSFFGIEQAGPKELITKSPPNNIPEDQEL